MSVLLSFALWNSPTWPCQLCQFMGWLRCRCSAGADIHWVAGSLRKHPRIWRSFQALMPPRQRFDSESNPDDLCHRLRSDSVYIPDAECPLIHGADSGTVRTRQTDVTSGSRSSPFVQPRVSGWNCVAFRHIHFKFKLIFLINFHVSWKINYKTATYRHAHVSSVQGGRYTPGHARVSNNLSWPWSYINNVDRDGLIWDNFGCVLRARLKPCFPCVRVKMAVTFIRHRTSSIL